MTESRASAPRRLRRKQDFDGADPAAHIADMIDLATRAKEVADKLGERFLAYLLAMVILEMSLIDRRANPGGTRSDAAAASPRSDSS